MNNVAFEIQSLLLKIREYKRINNLPLSPSFQKCFQEGSLSILQYSDDDEQVQIALVNFYSKLVYYDIMNKEILLNLIGQVQKISQISNIYLEKKLKFIRNCFESPHLDEELLVALYKLNKSVESVPNLLIKELARDSLSQALKKLALNCEQNLLPIILNELSNEIQSCYKNKNAETVKLIEYPYSILLFIMQMRQTTFNLIPMIVQLVKLDHPVLWNQLQQATLFLIEQNHDEDLLEIRTMLGQVVLRQLENSVAKLESMEIIQNCDSDTHFLIRFLFELFKSKERIQLLYVQTDMNPFLEPIFSKILQRISKLFILVRRLQTEEGKMLQKQVYELQIHLFQIGLTHKSKENLGNLPKFISDFNNEEIGPRQCIKNMPNEQVVNFLKYCSLYKEKLMIEILGCHKDNCVEILRMYVNTFNFTDLTIVESMRLLSSNFLLFGESQMIERVLDYFTNRYSEQNKGKSVFKHPDYIFTYTYAIILLNTDLYNKTLTKHMSLEDFVRNCNKINGGEELPFEILSQDYTNIANDEIICCRDFATTSELSPFVWKYYCAEKQIMKSKFKELIEYFEIQVDPEHYGDLILTEMVNNLEYLQDQGEEIVEKIMQVCINNEKVDCAQQMLNRMIKQNKIPLNYCYCIAEQLILYSTQFEGIINLIISTENDILNRDCQNVLLKIQNNNKFIKKNMGSNKGIFNLFQQFLQQEQEETADELIIIPTDCSDQISKIINQTKYLDIERLNEFFNILLNTTHHKFAQGIFIAVEILRVNTDRLLQFWPRVVELLQYQRSKLLSAYSNFILLKLIIEFLNQGDKLLNYEQCLQQGIQYLGDQSLEILFEFLQEIQKFLRNNSLIDLPLQGLQNIVHILLRILSVLEEKTLDKIDAEILMDHIKDIFERIQQYQNANALKIHLEVLNTLIRQKQLRSVASVDDFIAKHTLQIMKTYEEFIHEQNNSLLSSLVILACELSSEHLPKVVQIMMQVILNYNYKEMTEQEFMNLYQKMYSKQQMILQSKNDTIIINYAQYFQKLYFNWVSDSNFTLKLWIDFLTKFLEIMNSLKNTPLYESVGLSLESVCQHSHFQTIITSIAFYQIRKPRCNGQDQVVFKIDVYKYNFMSDLQAKKVKDIYFELNPNSLLQKGEHIETRVGLHSGPEKKINCIVKIMKVQGTTSAMTNQEEIKIYTTLQQIGQLSQGACPYLIQQLSFQKSKTTVYIAYEQGKSNLLQYKKQVTALMVVSLLDCMCQALKYLHSNNLMHGNIKPSNVFYCGKVNERHIFKTSDMKQQNKSTDLQDLGLLCKHFMRQLNNTELQELVQKLHSGQMNLNQLEMKIQKISEMLEMEEMKKDFLLRGVKQDYLSGLMRNSVQKQLIKNINEFKVPTTALSLRNKYQFYCLMAELIELQYLNDYDLNCLKFGCYQKGKNALHLSKQLECGQGQLESLLNQDIKEFDKFFEMLVLQSEFYLMNLELLDFDSSLLKSFINGEQIFEQAIAFIIKEIINKNISKLIQFENPDRKQIRTLNYIHLANQMIEEETYDYKSIVIYINSFDISLF